MQSRPGRFHGSLPHSSQYVMKTINTALFHRVLPPEADSSGPHPALILLHGMGADEEDLIGLVPELDDRLMVLSVRAPFPFPSGGYTWYSFGEIASPDPVTFADSCDRL